MSAPAPKIVNLFPPNFPAINRAFNLRGRPVIIAYGDKIYNPRRIEMTLALLAHETVHCKRQTDPEQWWAKYINSRAFRLQEETLAHLAELAVHGDVDLAARRLAAPLYGSLIGFDEARAILTRRS
jgi:hypothetical protein